MKKVKKYEFTSRELRESVLRVVLSSGFIAVSALAPGIAKWLGKDFIRYLNNRESDKKYKRILGMLRNEKLIEYYEDSDGFSHIKITEKGEARVKKYDFERLAVKTLGKWDGVWRVVMFDIPEDKKGARDALSLKLKRMGFYQMQKSIWIHPFPCSDEIDLVKEIYEISPYVTFAEIINIDKHNKLVKHFSNLIVD